MAQQGKKEYDDTDSGVLFPNKEKKTDKHPDFTGRINVKGTEFWLSAWKNESKDGGKYLKVRIQDKDEAPKSGGGFDKKRAPAAKPAAQADGAGDDW